MDGRPSTRFGQIVTYLGGGYKANSEADSSILFPGKWGRCVSAPLTLNNAPKQLRTKPETEVHKKKCEYYEQKNTEKPVGVCPVLKFDLNKGHNVVKKKLHCRKKPKPRVKKEIKKKTQISYRRKQNV